MIQLSNVYQSYGSKEVLKDISLVIPDNKITAIIGPNGAGKSTLFNVISRMIHKKSGSITIDDIDIQDKKVNLSKIIAVLKQNNHFNIKLTSYELISFGRFPHSKGRLNQTDLAKIDEIIDYLKLAPIKDQLIDTLSGGQLQRVLLAMVLVQDTKYILLDEPLNNLDIKYVIEMMNLLQRLVKDLGKTIVVIMHDINIASTFCHHAIAIKDGQVAYEGDIDDMMHVDTLNHIYDHQFCIREIDGRRICVFNQLLEKELQK